MEIKNLIGEGKTILGIELGSSRIKSILIAEDFTPISSGSHEWENQLENGIWTYSLDDVWKSLQNSFRNLSLDAEKRYGVKLEKIGAIGISAMMHGYLVFDKTDKALVPFRTWRNTTTEKAAEILTNKFQFNVPQRWSIAHLYQAVLNGEDHVKDIAFMTTLAGFVHWKLTGNKFLGIDDASGMFPIDNTSLDYDSKMMEQFDKIAADNGCQLKLKNILPKVLSAGKEAGSLTAEGAKLLDPSGTLQSGIPFCPPEGDAGTGMIATNSIALRTGNISAGTSVFAMIVLEKKLSKVYPEIDIVSTPSGKDVAMVHCNNCTTDLDAWVKLFSEVIGLGNGKIDKPELYSRLYYKAFEGDEDCGDLFSCNYYSGEPLTGIDEGRPLLVRMPNSNFTMANLMRTILFSILGALKYGIDILEKENVRIDSLLGHGGFFKTKDAGQRLMAAAFNTPVGVMEDSAGEGGAWGIALLAAFMLYGKGESLEKFLNEKVFAGKTGKMTEPDKNDIISFMKFMDRYKIGLNIEKSAIENFKM